MDKTVPASPRARNSAPALSPLLLLLIALRAVAAWACRAVALVERDRTLPDARHVLQGLAYALAADPGEDHTAVPAAEAAVRALDLWENVSTWCDERERLVKSDTTRGRKVVADGRAVAAQLRRAIESMMARGDA